MKTKGPTALKEDADTPSRKLPELTEIALEMVTGGAGVPITEDAKQLVDRLVFRANRDLFARYPDLNDTTHLTSGQIEYWNQQFSYYYSLLTEEEKRMVNAYLDLNRQE